MSLIRLVSVLDLFEFTRSSGLSDSIDIGVGRGIMVVLELPWSNLPIIVASLIRAAGTGSNILQMGHLVGGSSSRLLLYCLSSIGREPP